MCGRGNARCNPSGGFAKTPPLRGIGSPSWWWGRVLIPKLTLLLSSFGNKSAHGGDPDGMMRGSCPTNATRTRRDVAAGSAAIAGSIPARCLSSLLPRGTEAAPLDAASSSAAASLLVAIKCQSWEQAAPKFLLGGQSMLVPTRVSLPHKSGRDPTQHSSKANTHSSPPLPRSPPSFTHGSPGARLNSSCLTWWGERLQ